MNNIGSSNFVCWSIMEDYSDTFAQNFVTCCKEAVSGTLPEKKLLLVGTELFEILFLSSHGNGHNQEIQAAFQKIIKSTNKAYIILSRTWLIMAKDIIDCLVKQNGELNHLEIFLGRINELSELLTDVYFEESKRPAIHKSNIDLTSQEHRGIVSIFGKYLDLPDNDKDDDEENELKIHTYYRSIPVELNATVRQVDDNSVTFNIHPYEAVALSAMNMAHIKSSLHLGVFRGYATHVDIKDRIATFSNFEKLDHPVERRANIRVEPKGIIKAKIFINENALLGRILDISEMATAIYVRNVDTETLASGTTINFSAKLPSLYDKEPISIKTKGTISIVHKNTGGDADAHRVVIHWEANAGLSSKLAQYISQRQVEIMRELKELSEDT